MPELKFSVLYSEIISFGVFSHIVYNTETHMRIVEMLLMHGQWGEKLPEFVSAPALPPRKISRALLLAEEDSPRTLQEAEWYWGLITRYDIISSQPFLLLVCFGNCMFGHLSIPLLPNIILFSCLCLFDVTPSFHVVTNLKETPM